MNAYQILHHYFISAGLMLVQCEWYPKKDGGTSFRATLQSVKEGKISRINGGSHTDFVAHGNTPDEVVEKIFAIAKTEKLWLGPCGDYHSVIEWCPSTGQFIARKLTEEEDIRKNYIV